MSIHVKEFKWEPGVNDAEYIRLLKQANEEAHRLMLKATGKLVKMAKSGMYEWISVRDKLPEDNKYVLAVFASGALVVACVFEHDEDAVYWRAQTDDGWESDMDFDPTHWMPLPEPPKD